MPRNIEFTRVVGVVHNAFAHADQQQITRDTTVITGDTDSLELAMFQHELEDEFNVGIPDAEIRKAKTVGDICDMLERIP